ncbi:hypothetical protein ABZ490_17720 [Streptomyces sp. NPDC005811]|uniref:hypothetical protein n=1 Tax=Streptomyces sp. NPDC005811 TaxID=3154565 RepID=UPI0033D85C90
MPTLEEQIKSLKEKDEDLARSIANQIDKTELDAFFTSKKKLEQDAEKQAAPEKEKALKKLISDEIEKAGQSAWKPDSRWYKTPEFMGFVSALTGSLIGLTLVKYDFAVFDITEKVNRLALRLVNYITGRTQWDRQFLTSEQKDERKLNGRFSAIEHRLARQMKNANKRIGAVETRVARIERSGRDVRERVGSVAASPGSIPQSRSAAAELENLHSRIDALVAALG